jgi:peptide deformylase
MQRKAFEVNPQSKNKAKVHNLMFINSRIYWNKKGGIEEFEACFSIRFVAKFDACLKLE